jgi:hypothetical protein
MKARITGHETIDNNNFIYVGFYDEATNKEIFLDKIKLEPCFNEADIKTIIKENLNTAEKLLIQKEIIEKLLNKGITADD